MNEYDTLTCTCFISEDVLTLAQKWKIYHAEQKMKLEVLMRAELLDKARSKQLLIETRFRSLNETELLIKLAQSNC